MRPLTAYEQRVIGVLIEKSITTPDQYPLSLNSLVNGCNQKSNREPIMELAESTVQIVVDGLVSAGLVTELSGFGSRVVKYQQRFCNTEFSEVKLSPRELAIVCTLLLRGPQTAGELRTRCVRLAEFPGSLDVEKALQQLLTRPDGAIVERLARDPGHRESRWRHLFGDPDEAAAPPAVSTRTAQPTINPEKSNLEARVTALEAEVADLKELVNSLL